MRKRFLRGALWLCSAGLALALGPATAAGANASDTRVETLLAQSRAALGGTALDRRTVVRLDGRVTQGGLAGTGTRWLEIGGTRFAESFVTQPITGADGFDGSVAWNADGSGLVWVDGGGAGRAQAISSSFVADDALWSKKRGGATVSWGGTRSVKGVKYDSLTVTAPGSPLPFDVWFDRNTHLPVRLVQSVGPLSAATTYSGYRRVAGIMLPFALHNETSDGNMSDAAVSRAAVDPPGARKQLAKPNSNVHDFLIACGAAQTRVPFDLVENHVYLDVKLDGKGPYRFVFDTGGVNIVDPQVAREIGASGKGSVQGGGVGSTTESISFAKGGDCPSVPRRSKTRSSSLRRCGADSASRGAVRSTASSASRFFRASLRRSITPSASSCLHCLVQGRQGPQAASCPSSSTDNSRNSPARSTASPPNARSIPARVTR